MVKIYCEDCKQKFMEQDKETNDWIISFTGHKPTYCCEECCNKKYKLKGQAI